MGNLIVRRVFGRTADKGKVDQFSNWFTDNIDKLEEAVNENKPFNGQLLVDWQVPTQAYVIEVQTSNEEFANEIKAKYDELEFDDSAIIGDVKAI
jgi:hypothetical protein